MNPHRGRVLLIAGSDSGGGAGVQADIKTVTALGGYAATSITAITVQNTLGVSEVHPVPADLVVRQARAVLNDIGADAIKTGMLGDESVALVVAALIEGAAGIPAVVDPVIVAKGGAALMSEGAMAVVRDRLLPVAALFTPNAIEAAAMTGRAIETADDLRRAGEALLRQGARAVLMKGGHVPGDEVVDWLMTPAGESRFSGPRLPTRHTHGTGCTLASACAALIAQGATRETAVRGARAYTVEAIRAAPGFGAGAGPLGHAWPFHRPGELP